MFGLDFTQVYALAMLATLVVTGLVLSAIDHPVDLDDEETDR